MTSTDLIATDRLRLHRPTLHDLAPIHALHADDWSLEQTHAAVERWIAHWEGRGFGYWVIRNDAGEFVGIGGLGQDDDSQDAAVHFHYRIAPRARGRGYATELGLATLDVAFNALQLRRVETFVQHDDTRSIEIATRVGMRPTGQMNSSGAVRYVVERRSAD